MSKNRVRIGQTRVVKQFMEGHHRRRRFRRERRALRRLRCVDGIPRVLESRSERLQLMIERVPGRPFRDGREVAPTFYRQLNALVERMLEQGLRGIPCRHATSSCAPTAAPAWWITSA